MGAVVVPSLGPLGPDAVKASRFEPGVDDHCVCRLLGGVAADGRAGIAGLPITHPLAVAADSANGGGDFASPSAFSLERPQCIDHLAHALGIICQDGRVRVEPRRAPGALGPSAASAATLREGQACQATGITLAVRAAQRCENEWDCL